MQNRFHSYFQESKKENRNINSVELDFSLFTDALAQGVSQLLNVVDVVFMAGSMSPEEYNLYAEFISNRTIEDTPENRRRAVQDLLFIMFSSASFAVQK